MDLNSKLMFKINNAVGKSELLDAFGRAGAEFVIVAMMGWYVAADFLQNYPSKHLVFWPLAFFAIAWGLGWVLDLLIGMATREVRPYASYPNVKLLFKPLTSWKTFPSDHAMSAFLIFFMALLFNLPGAGALLIMALWICWGRVYAGVHYPLDILGGVAVAAFVYSLSCYIISVVF